jgi:predicted O-methyltransferase YrrM
MTASSPRERLHAASASLFATPPANRLLRRHRVRLLDEALARGLTPRLEEPLRWLATGELAAEDRARVDGIEAIRRALAARKGANAPTRGGGPVPLRRVALAASVDRRFGTLLYLCGKAIEARTGLELGSAVGIGTAYLASGTERVISIEASPDRAAIARDTVASVGAEVEVVVGRFRRVLPDVLEELDDGLDIAWIDGHHRRRPTLRYFDAIRPKLNAGAVVAFDDIRQRAGMREAWSILQRTEGFTDTLDLDAIGIGVWGGAGAKPRVHDLRGIHGRPRWLHRGAAAGSPT